MSVAKIIAMMGGIRPAQFIAENHYAKTAADLVVSLTGAAAGDLAILIFNYATTGLAGWTQLTPQAWAATDNRVAYKVLSSADIATGSVTLSDPSTGGVAMILFYRGATSVADRSDATGNATSLALSGFTQSAVSKCVLTFVMTGVASGGSIVRPTGLTQRVAPFGSGFVSAAVAEVTPANAYISGTGMTWTGLTTGGGATSNSAGQILELT